MIKFAISVCCFDCIDNLDSLGCKLKELFSRNEEEKPVNNGEAEISSEGVGSSCMNGLTKLLKFILVYGLRTCNIWLICLNHSLINNERVG